jgi:hypothetical protein
MLFPGAEARNVRAARPSPSEKSRLPFGLEK